MSEASAATVPPVHRVYTPEPALPLSADCGLIAWTLIGTTDAARVTCPECRDASPWLYRTQGESRG